MWGSRAASDRGKGIVPRRSIRSLYGAHLMDMQVLAILAGLCALVIGLAVYVLSRLSLFSKTPKDGLPVSSSEFELTGASFVFYGLMVVCMLVSVWAVQALGLQDKRGLGLYGPVLILEGLIFVALYLALQSLGVKFKKKRV